MYLDVSDLVSQIEDHIVEGSLSVVREQIASYEQAARHDAERDADEQYHRGYRDGSDEGWDEARKLGFYEVFAEAGNRDCRIKLTIESLRMDGWEIAQELERALYKELNYGASLY